jgi:phospholipid/cholesterol/gamma-HCH transport system substrate-binding protein
MDSKINYIAVGLFVLLFSVALIIGVLWLSTGGPHRDYNRYIVYMKGSVSGLSKDSIVEYRGVDVGKITQIRLDPDNPERVRLLLDIEQGTPIKQDTVAVQEVNALTGIAKINLTGGSQGSPSLRSREGEPEPVIPSKPSQLQELGQSISQMLAVVTETAGRMNSLLNDRNLQAVEETLVHLEVLTGTFEKASADLTVMFQSARVASARLPLLLTQIEDSASAMERMADEIAKVATALNETVAISGQQLERFTLEALPETTALISELRESAQNLRRWSEQMETDPSVLLYSAPTPQPGPGE